MEDNKYVRFPTYLYRNTYQFVQYFLHLFRSRCLDGRPCTITTFPAITRVAIATFKIVAVVVAV